MNVYLEYLNNIWHHGIYITGAKTKTYAVYYLKQNTIKDKIWGDIAENITYLINGKTTAESL